MEKYRWKRAANEDLLKLLSTLFGLHLEMQNADQFLVNRVKGKLKYWNSTHLSLASENLICESSVNVIPLVFHRGVGWFQESIGED